MRPLGSEINNSAPIKYDFLLTWRLLTLYSVINLSDALLLNDLDKMGGDSFEFWGSAPEIIAHSAF